MLRINLSLFAVLILLAAPGCTAPPFWAQNQASVDTVWLRDTRGLRSPALMALAPVYLRGDYAEVLRVIRPLAESGDGEAQAYLAHLYSTGRGVSKDISQAIEWIISASKNGIPVAQHTLATLTFNGQGGVARDEKEAIRLLTAAAEQNDTYAIEQLGRAYLGGNGVDRDFTKAVKWFCRGVALKSGLSMWNIGFALMTGSGLPSNVVEGRKWMALAIKHLDPGVNPRQFRGELAYFSRTRMTPDQIAETNNQAKAWNPGGKCP